MESALSASASAAEGVEHRTVPISSTVAGTSARPNLHAKLDVWLTRDPPATTTLVDPAAGPLAGLREESEGDT